MRTRTKRTSQPGIFTASSTAAGVSTTRTKIPLFGSTTSTVCARKASSLTWPRLCSSRPASHEPRVYRTCAVKLAHRLHVLFANLIACVGCPIFDELVQVGKRTAGDQDIGQTVEEGHVDRR